VRLLAQNGEDPQGLRADSRYEALFRPPAVTGASIAFKICLSSQMRASRPDSSVSPVRPAISFAADRKAYKGRG